MTRVFAVSGYSGSGKTTLVERIVSALVNSGYKVATLKSSMHAKGDEEGSDTWRHRQAGSSHTFFVDQSIADSGETDLVGVLRDAGAEDVDFLIIEGMKKSPFPKVWCTGETESCEGLPPNTKAVVTWGNISSCTERSLPVYTMDELDLILETVVRGAVHL